MGWVMGWVMGVSDGVEIVGMTFLKGVGVRWITVSGVFGRKEMFYLTPHSTHFIYGYMALDIWLRTILIVRKETHCRHIGYSFRLTARVLLYAPSHRQGCFLGFGQLWGGVQGWIFNSIRVF